MVVTAVLRRHLLFPVGRDSVFFLLVEMVVSELVGVASIEVS